MLEIEKLRTDLETLDSDLAVLRRKPDAGVDDLAPLLVRGSRLKRRLELLEQPTADEFIAAELLIDNGLDAPTMGRARVAYFLVKRMRAAAEAKAKAKAKPKAAKRQTRSWTQAAVDAHIQQLLDRIQKGLSSLAKKCDRGDGKAQRIAKNTFGIRALMRSMNLGSPRQIQKSAVWMDIRRQLPCLGRRGRGRGKTIGLEMGVEQIGTREWQEKKHAQKALEAAADILLKNGKRLP